MQRRTGFRRSLIGWAPQPRAGHRTGFRTRLLFPLVILGVGLFLAADVFLIVGLMSDGDATPSADRLPEQSSEVTREVPASGDRIRIGAPMLSDEDVERFGARDDRAGDRDERRPDPEPSPAASGSSSTGSSSTGSSSTESPSTESSDTEGSDSGGSDSGDSGDSDDSEPPPEGGPGGGGPGGGGGGSGDDGSGGGGGGA